MNNDGHVSVGDFIFLLFYRYLIHSIFAEYGLS